MLPWNWMWAPQWHFPFSGSLTQDISPDTSWFFGAIRPGAGIGSIEREVFDVVSYGRQLGLILDVLVPLAGKNQFASAEEEEAFQKLKNAYLDIEEVKDLHKGRMEAAAVALLARIQESDPRMLERVIAKVKPGSSAWKELPL
jgi:hypothetical protein